MCSARDPAGSGADAEPARLSRACSRRAGAQTDAQPVRRQPGGRKLIGGVPTLGRPLRQCGVSLADASSSGLFDPVLFEQPYLITRVQHLPPVLHRASLSASPWLLNVSLGSPATPPRAILLLELPAPGHAPTASLVRGMRQ